MLTPSSALGGVLEVCNTCHGMKYLSSERESGKKSKQEICMWIISVCNAKAKAIPELVTLATGCSKYVSNHYILAGSIPDEVIGLLNSLTPSSRTEALGSRQATHSEPAPSTQQVVSNNRISDLYSRVVWFESLPGQ
jgi:hypothetical protein